MNPIDEISRDYIPHPFSFKRFSTRIVGVGDVKIGGNEPIILQSMVTSDTMDTQAVVDESIAMHDVGSSLVRITAPGPTDSKNLKVIKDKIKERGRDIPIVADIHFTPKAAMVAVEHVEKVRINPGNFCDTKKFKVRDYSDSEYDKELNRIRDVFLPLVIRAKELGRAIRIGANHGSLSDRILNRYGDTPIGMVESAMEYLRIAKDQGYFDLVVSMKASNPQVMIQAYRLLARKFIDEDMDFPLHLGVTEAGFARDGRIKSAVGIGALLLDGLGDTIRVSLTEDAVNELPPARKIAALHKNPFPMQTLSTKLTEIEKAYTSTVNPYQYTRFKTNDVQWNDWKTGKRNPVGLILSFSQEEIISSSFNKVSKESIEQGLNAITCSVDINSSDIIQKLASLPLPVFISMSSEAAKIHSDIIQNNKNLFARIKISTSSDLVDDIFSTLAKQKVWIDLNDDANKETSIDDFYEHVSSVITLLKKYNMTPVFSINNNTFSLQLNRMLVAALKLAYKEKTPPLFLQATGKTEDDLLYKNSAICGSLFLDGIGDCLVVDCPSLPQQDRMGYGLDLLQATRLRLSKTEFISCPSCGRTIFELQKTTAMIKERTGHLKGLKIAVMGCIVNGPGEMADADFGYVGAGPGKIHLYREKELVKNNIPSDDAVDELIALIKEHGMWQDV